MAHDVFISYSSKDQKIVEALSAYLKQQGIRCFVAYRDIPKGMVWAEAITEAIENCKMMIVVFSQHFNRSKQVNREIEMCIKLAFISRKEKKKIRLWKNLMSLVKKDAQLYIPVTESSFDNYYRFGRREYDHLVQDFIKKGHLLVDARIKSNAIEVSYCLDEGCGPDEDGYGMEPSRDLIAILDGMGNFVVSFTQSGFTYCIKELTIINHLIELDIPVLDEQGKINARCEKTADKRWEKIGTQGLCGMLDLFGIAVPCLYKNVELLEKLDDTRYSFCVQTTDDKYGLYLPFSAKESIPAIYYAPFKIIDTGIIATTQQDGSEIRFEIKKISYSRWTADKINQSH